jgi:hypothetical protein
VTASASRPTRWSSAIRAHRSSQLGRGGLDEVTQSALETVRRGAARARGERAGLGLDEHQQAIGAQHAVGLAGDLGPLRDTWRDAYGAISRASRLEIVGYSMPPDDIEIRTLLRAGVQRGREQLHELVVRNPETGVHERVRRYLDRTVTSKYQGVQLAN